MAGRIKIVYLIGELGYGGSERQLFLLLKHFDQKAFELYVVVFNRSRHLVYNDALAEIGIKVIEIPENCRGILRRIWFLHRWLNKIKPHIIHSWTVHDNPYAGVLGLLHGIPIRWGSVRGSISLPDLQSLPIFLQWLSLKSVSKITVNSRVLIQELLGKGLNRKDIVLIQNCVDCNVPENAPDLSAHGVEKIHKLIGTVGNIRQVKNHKMFIEGMAGILPGRDDVIALVVGQAVPSDADLPEILNSQIKELGLKEKVILTGFYPNVPALMRNLSIFCLTSNSEGTPNAVLEAMAAARPVVATRVGGIPDIVQDHASGFLIEPGDVVNFAGAVKKLLDDPDLAERMGLAGQEIVKRHYSCEVITRQLEMIYKQSLEEHR